MSAINIGSAIYGFQRTQGQAGIGQTQAPEPKTQSAPAAGPEKTAAPRAKAAIIAAPRVSDAVGKTLLHLQETGSVFGDKDAGLMNSRGVTDADRERFAQIVQDAAETGAYNDPIAYIKSLPAEDVDVLRRVHSLAETRGVIGTDTVEGAVNLLLPPQNHVDINDDGLVTNGTATGFQFPPPNAPQSVKDAWEDATEHMTASEKMLASTPFLSASIGANAKLDADGTVRGFYDHTDPSYRNIFGTSEAEWDALLDKMIANLKDSAKSDANREKQLELLKRFAGSIDNGASA